jgi:hypothetical protein
MAEVVTIDGQEYKKRSPWGAWGLAIVTLGIYGFVWYYKINDEARRYLKDESIKPGISVLALIPGFILIVPPFVSYWRTAQRVERMEEKGGIAKTVEPILGLLAALVYALHIVYLQSHLNKLWDKAQQPSVSAPMMTPGTPPLPPPPPLPAE